MNCVFVLFKGSRDSFLKALDDGSIRYNPVEAFSSGVMASASLIAISQALAPSAAVAAIVVQWLKSRASRKVIVTTGDNEVVHLEGYSVAEVEKILASAVRVAVVDTGGADPVRTCPQSNGPRDFLPLSCDR